MSKKQVNWVIGIICSIITIILGGIGIHKESRTFFFIIAAVFLLLSLFYLLYSSYKEKKSKEVFEKENKQLKKILKQREDKIQTLKSNTCQECRKIYWWVYPDDEWISFSENPNKNECFSFVEEMSDEGEERVVYHLDNQWIFVSFWDKEEGDYLIDLIGKEVYFPIGKSQESKRDSLLNYRILCSKRRNHFGIEEIDKLV